MHLTREQREEVLGLLDQVRENKRLSTLEKVLFLQEEFGRGLFQNELERAGISRQEARSLVSKGKLSKKQIPMRRHNVPGPSGQEVYTLYNLFFVV